MNRLLQSMLIALGIAISLPATAADMAGMDMGAKPIKTARGLGVIKGIDTKQGTVTLAHQPIKEMNWPAMTMEFKVSDSKLLAGRTTGEKVSFELKGGDASPIVTAIQPVK